MGGVAGVVGDLWDQGGGVGGWELVEWQWKDVHSSPTVTQSHTRVGGMWGRTSCGLAGCRHNVPLDSWGNRGKSSNASTDT